MIIKGPLRHAVTLALALAVFALLPATAATATLESAPQAAGQPAAAMIPQSATTVQQTAVDAPSSYCYAGRWTQVRALWHPFGWPLGEHYQVYSSVFVEYRWFQDGIPQYWYGTFTGVKQIYYTPSWYTSIEFKCAVDSPVWIYPLN